MKFLWHVITRHQFTPLLWSDDRGEWYTTVCNFWRRSRRLCYWLGKDVNHLLQVIFTLYVCNSKSNPLLRGVLHRHLKTRTNLFPGGSKLVTFSHLCIIARLILCSPSSLQQMCLYHFNYLYLIGTYTNSKAVGRPTYLCLDSIHAIYFFLLSISQSPKSFTEHRDSLGCRYGFPTLLALLSIFFPQHLRGPPD